MLGLIRNAFALMIGWLLMKLISRLVTSAQNRSQAQERVRDEQENTRAQRSDHMLDMKPCPVCGVYTSGSCTNTQCTAAQKV